MLENKIKASLMGVFIGDAMGLPVECQSPQSIRQLFGYLDRMQPNKHSPFKRVARRAAGSISDDSQLTLALMDSFSSGYYLSDLKRAHVDALNGKWGTPLGWGKSTWNSVLALKNNTWTQPTEGAGNGTCMKISPLAHLYAVRSQKTKFGKYINDFNISLLNRCAEISQITHGDPRCIVAAYCQCKMIIRALQDEIPLYPMTIAQLFIDDARFAENNLIATWPEDGLLSTRIAKFVKDPIDGISPFDIDTNVISTKICVSQSSYVMNSYPFVAYCTAKYLPSKNFKRILLETINAGADADSNGSMVSAISGALLGLENVPLNLFMKLKAHKMLLNQIESFYQKIK